MDAPGRGFHASRVVSGVTLVRPAGRAFLAGNPSRGARYLAEEVYREAHGRAVTSGAVTEGEALDLLRGKGLWSGEDDDAVSDAEKAVEDGKVGLIENWGEPNARVAIGKVIRSARGTLSGLLSRRHSLDHVTCEGVAAVARVRFLTGASLKTTSGTPYWRDPLAGYERPDGVVDEVVALLAASRLDESGLRELARTDPWRSLWGGRKASGRGVFDAASADLTDEQRVLLLWSSAYDSIREHPEPPPDDAFDDDDAVDGWMILKRRERYRRVEVKRGDGKISDKVRNCTEIYLPAGDAAEARAISARNDGLAKMILAQRYAALREKGVVNEVEMPDVQRDLRMQMTNAIRGG